MTNFLQGSQFPGSSAQWYKENHFFVQDCWIRGLFPLLTPAGGGGGGGLVRRPICCPQFYFQFSLDTVSTPGEESFLRLKKKEETCWFPVSNSLVQFIFNPRENFSEDLIFSLRRLEEELVTGPWVNLQHLLGALASPSSIIDVTTWLWSIAMYFFNLYSKSDPSGLQSLSISPWTNRNGVLWVIYYILD